MPEGYNAAIDLLAPNLASDRGARTAVIDAFGQHSYSAIAERVDRFANAVLQAGVQPEQRIGLLMLDDADLVAAFLGALKAGVVPILLNTLLTPADYGYMLADSRARLLVVSPELQEKATAIDTDLPHLQRTLVTGTDEYRAFLGDVPGSADAADTVADDMAFWLYTSGSTGRPKGVVHLHGNLRATWEGYAKPVLGLGPEDVTFSAAKLFFAYGLGNSLTFPFAAGCPAVLLRDRPTPESVCAILRDRRPTVFFGVPTLYAQLLASDLLPGKAEHALRLATSAGEALPADIGKRWQARMGTEILDGIGSTEMLHIFLTNRPGEVRYGTTGRAAPGYELRLVGEEETVLGDGEVGDLEVKGPSSAAFYWNKRAKSTETFRGSWTRTGDKYERDAEGYYTYSGRADDMLKVGGIYVSPFEVENALTGHEAVLECAVVGCEDDEGLIKPKAYVVLAAGREPSNTLANELQDYVKSRLALYKYPRWIEFRESLPKTATGKIQRFLLRNEG